MCYNKNQKIKKKSDHTKQSKPKGKKIENTKLITQKKIKKQ
jgi:hypothetical protein